ncbi:hypothetical protein DFS34DRAFT_299921 [Phlyctochytrium arcticum]|nr:hypothetical protein DFS34DRAFT_299921 [Phlyctochytrium arcticum]
MTSTPAAFGGSSSNWTMHPTGKYFISKNSPWCYNESSGYFYFDNMGRMIRQEEQQQQQQLQSTSTSSTGTPDAPLGTTGSTAQNAIETTPVVIVQKAAPKSMEDGEIQEPNESEKLADLMSKSGYVPMEDPRYFFHAQSGYVYDSITASYSYWDSSSNTYIPVPAQQQKRPQRQVLRPPSADAVLKLVVQESKLLKSGDIIMVTESGLAVGRDRTFEKRLVLNEVAVSRFHCSIHVSREREDIIPDPEPVVETPSSTAKPESTQQHVPPSSSQQPATHGVEPQKEGLQVLHPVFLIFPPYFSNTTEKERKNV